MFRIYGLFHKRELVVLYRTKPEAQKHKRSRIGLSMERLVVWNSRDEYRLRNSGEAKLPGGK